MLFVPADKILTKLTPTTNRILCLVTKKIVPSGGSGPQNRNTLFGTAISQGFTKATPLMATWDIKEVEKALITHKIDALAFAFPFEESVTSMRRMDYDRTSVMVYFEYFDKYSNLFAFMLDDIPNLGASYQLSQKDPHWADKADLLKRRFEKKESGGLSLDAAAALHNFLAAQAAAKDSESS